MVYLHVEAVLDGFHCQFCAAVAESVGDPVVLVLIAVQQNRHAGAALDGDQPDDVILDVERDQDHAVGARVVAELGGVLRAVELVQVGEGIGVVDGLGALVGADEQDVQHVVVRERAALGHCHLAFGVGQAGSVQVLVLVRTDLTHLADAAVIIAQQVELAVDVKGRQHSQHSQNADNNDRDFAALGQAPPRVPFLRSIGCFFGSRFQFVHILLSPVVALPIILLCRGNGRPYTYYVRFKRLAICRTSQQ